MYTYERHLDFNGQPFLPIYRTNMNVYGTAKYVDAAASTLLLLSSYKLSKQYAAYQIGKFSMFATGNWSTIFLLQAMYLIHSHMHQAYLIESIELSSDLKRVKLSMILSGPSYNLYALFSKAVKRQEIVYDIGEVKFSKDDSAEERVLRLMAGDKQFYCHRNRASVKDPELIGAIFNSEVKELRAI